MFPFCDGPREDWSVSAIVNALSYLFADVLKRYACEKAMGLVCFLLLGVMIQEL